MWIEDKLYQQIVASIPIVCVDVAIIYREDHFISITDHLLLVKRADEPCICEWWFPGGRLFKGETLEACALRKAKEETGLSCQLKNIVYYASTDFGKIHSVNFVYQLWANGNKVKLDDTCLDYKWVNKGEDLSKYNGYVREAVIRTYVNLP